MEKISHYCQKCRAANEPGEIECRNCGTPLMIVTLPPSLRHEQEIIPSYYEDHLLERVTLLELRLSQLTGQLALAYEFISRQTESFEKDHVIIQSFMDSIGDINPDLGDSLAKKFTQIFSQQQENYQKQNERQILLNTIYSNHTNSNQELFAHLVEEGMDLLVKKEEKQGFRTLEKAVLLSPANLPLISFMAESLFAADKFELAKNYLEKIFKISPQNTKTLLLLGVIYADEANTEKARKYLSVLTGKPDQKICANYIWGILAAFEKNWQESLLAFRECLEDVPNPEILYLIGCCYFQLGKFEKSLKYLESAIKKDFKFADAWFMKSIVLLKLNELEKADLAKDKAFDSKETGAKCLLFYRNNDLRTIEIALPFQHFNEKNKRLLTNASVRLTKFFQKQILNRQSSTNTQK
jgi:tetratricopeptide (TPR) repeat protein